MRQKRSWKFGGEGKLKSRNKRYALKKKGKNENLGRGAVPPYAIKRKGG